MKIFVKAKTNAKENKIIPPPLKLIDGLEEWYTVLVKETPIEGRANEAIIKLLAEYFKVARYQIKLVSGAKSKTKVFKIDSEK